MHAACSCNSVTLRLQVRPLSTSAGCCCAESLTEPQLKAARDKAVCERNDLFDEMYQAERAIQLHLPGGMARWYQVSLLTLPAGLLASVHPSCVFQEWPSLRQCSTADGLTVLADAGLSSASSMLKKKKKKKKKKASMMLFFAAVRHDVSSHADWPDSDLH